MTESTGEHAKEQLEALLKFLRSERGFDFSGYKRATLTRRIEKRMSEVGVDSPEEYLDHLQAHPDEFEVLFNAVLINVTSFFRDPTAWAYLSGTVVPRLLETGPIDRPVRIWSAGCASGQEAYTLAMVFEEAQEGRAQKRPIKIYGTDIDEEALAQARSGLYSASEVEGLDPALLERYFVSEGESFRFRNDLRRTIIFGRHDLVQDAPISKLDLIVCRNTLMYLNAETQGRVLSRLHFALNDHGAVFVGKAELLLTRAKLFVAEDAGSRVFAKVVGAGGRAVQHEPHLPDVPEVKRPASLTERAFEMSPLPQLIFNSDGNLVSATISAMSALGLTPRDLGRPLQDLEISYRPIELRGPIDQAYGERRTIYLRDVEWLQRRGAQYLDISIVPSFGSDGSRSGTLVAFDDVSRYHALQVELQRSANELEAAYSELQTTNEELETTNEELQATVEELETTNEELHATNEELETMNEELQATNDELRVANDDLRSNSDKLDRMTSFTQSILASLPGAVVVLGDDLTVRLWSQKAFDLWGVREEEALGKRIDSLDIGLPVESVLERLQAQVRASDGEVERLSMDARDRRGRPIVCNLTLSPLTDGATRGAGVVVQFEVRE